MAGFCRLFLAFVSSGILAFWPSCVTLEGGGRGGEGWRRGGRNSGRASDRLLTVPYLSLLFFMTNFLVVFRDRERGRDNVNRKLQNPYLALIKAKTRI